MARHLSSKQHKLLSWLPLICMLVALSGQLYANTHIVTTSVNMADMGYETAKEMAIKQAIQKVLFAQGGQFAASTKITNGIVNNQQLTLNHHGQLTSANIISEHRHDGFLTVEVAVDLAQNKGACQTQPNSINTVMSEFTFASPEHAQDNQIQALARFLPTQLAYISQKQQSLLDISYISNDTWFTGLQQHAKASIQLGLQHNAPYIIVGQIDDASTQRTFPTTYAFWKTPQAQRQMALRLHVYDTFTGDKVMDKGYHFTSQWPFTMEEAISLTSARFLQSEFAQRINELIIQAHHDVQSTIACREKRARIIAIDKQRIVINVGTNQGIHEQSTFALIQQKQQLDAQGNNVLLTQPLDTQLNVVATMPNSSVIVSEDTWITQNIQPNDWVVILN